MIDLERLKKWCAGVVLDAHIDEDFLTDVNLNDLISTIKAIEEAKEIFDFQTCDECGNSFNDEKGVKEWLSRYFPDTRKEE